MLKLYNDNYVKHLNNSRLTNGGIKSVYLITKLCQCDYQIDQLKSQANQVRMFGANNFQVY